MRFSFYRWFSGHKLCQLCRGLPQVRLHRQGIVLNQSVTGKLPRSQSWLFQCIIPLAVWFYTCYEKYIKPNNPSTHFQPWGSLFSIIFHNTHYSCNPPTLYIILWLSHSYLSFKIYICFWGKYVSLRQTKLCWCCNNKKKTTKKHTLWLHCKLRFLEKCLTHI